MKEKSDRFKGALTDGHGNSIPDSREKPKSPEEILKEELDNYFGKDLNDFFGTVGDEVYIAAITKYHQQFKLSDSEIAREANSQYPPLSYSAWKSFIKSAKWAQSKIFGE